MQHPIRYVRNVWVGAANRAEYLLSLKMVTHRYCRRNNTGAKKLCICTINTNEFIVQCAFQRNFPVNLGSQFFYIRITGTRYYSRMVRMLWCRR